MIPRTQILSLGALRWYIFYSSIPLSTSSLLNLDPNHMAIFSTVSPDFFFKCLWTMLPPLSCLEEPRQKWVSIPSLYDRYQASSMEARIVQTLRDVLSKGPLCAWNLVLCVHHLEMFSNFIFKLVLKWNPMAQWSMHQDLEFEPSHVPTPCHLPNSMGRVLSSYYHYLIPWVLFSLHSGSPVLKSSLLHFLTSATFHSGQQHGHIHGRSLHSSCSPSLILVS